MEIANGSFIPFSYTVKEFYDFWFYHHMIGQKRITYNTYNAYRNIIENYLLPAIGHKMLNTLQRKDLVNALSAIPYQKVQRTAIGVVTGSLCYARKHNYISRDIYTGISSEVRPIIFYQRNRTVWNRGPTSFPMLLLIGIISIIKFLL